MRLVSADKSTGQFRDPPPGEGGDGSTTRMLVRPVFTRGGDKRRRMLVRGGYLAVASCVAYLAMVLVSVTASPSARPATDAEQPATATTVNRVTPERPSRPPSAAAPAVPAVRPKPAAPAPAPPSAATPVPATPTAAASGTPAASATAEPTKKSKSSAAAASKTPAPPKTSTRAA
jgi:hypothetical protein